MATQFCQKCKQAHPGRVCDYDDKGECAETADVDDNPKAPGERPGEKNSNPPTIIKKAHR
jgi:hypothetical protein